MLLIGQYLDALGWKYSIRNDWAIIHCPVPERHSGGVDKKPSCGVNGTGFIHCFSCGFRGDIRNYFGIADFSGVSLAVDTDKHVWDIDIMGSCDHIPWEPSSLGSMCNALDSGIACSYLTYRGASIESISRYGMLYEKKSSMVVAPIIGFDGFLYGAHGRSVKQKKFNRFTYGDTHARLFGEHVADFSDACFVCESFIDVLSVSRYYPNAISPLSAHMTGGHIDVLSKFPEVYMLLDGDAAGVSGGRKASGLLRKRGVICHEVMLPDGQDPCSLGADICEVVNKYIDKSETMCIM